MGRFGIVKERLRLRATRYRPATADRLRPLADADLRTALADPAARRDCAAFCERFAALGLPPLPAGANLGDRRALYHFVHHFRPRRILEIGTCNGSSTAFLAGALAACGTGRGDGGRRLVTVDITDVNDPGAGYWRKAGVGRSPRAILEGLGLDRLVRFEAGGSAALLDADDATFDFVFIDGDHRAPGVYRDVAGVLRRLGAGAVVLLHDFYPGGRPLWRGEPPLPGPALALERLVREVEDLEIRAVADLPWPTKQGTCRTSLAALTRRFGGSGSPGDIRTNGSVSPERPAPPSGI